MSKHSVLALAFVALVSSFAHAQPANGGCPVGCDEQPAQVAPQIDLRPPTPAPELEPRGLHMALSTARAVRTAGIALTVSGIVASAIGTAAIGTYYSSNSPISYTQMTDMAAGGLTVGAIGIGSGVAMWASADYEVQRAEGRAPALTPALRLRRGRNLRIAGAVLTAIGGAMTIASIAALAAPTGCQSGGGDDLCGLGNILVGGALGGVASTFFGAGIPLLAVGLSETRAGQGGFTIDSFGPRAMPNGGGVGISGRF